MNPKLKRIGLTNMILSLAKAGKSDAEIRDATGAKRSWVMAVRIKAGMRRINRPDRTEKLKQLWEEIIRANSKTSSGMAEHG